MVEGKGALTRGGGGRGGLVKLLVDRRGAYSRGALIRRFTVTVVYCRTSFLLSVVAPTITSFVVPRLVRLGMNATLTCAVSGIPQPGITWYRDSVLLSVTSSVFVVDHVNEADGGVYTCITSNAAGRNSKHGNLTVQG